MASADDGSSATNPFAGLTPEFVAGYKRLFEHLQVYLVCLTTILIWDWLVTIRTEVKYLWPAKMSTVKVCFFIARYLTIAHMGFMMGCTFSEQLTIHCQQVYRIQDVVPIIIFLCCNFKLAQRCASLFYRPRPIFYFLLVLVAAQAAVQGFCSAKNSPVPPPPGMIGCFTYPSAGNENYAFVYWVLPLFTHTLILVITVVKVVLYWRIIGRTHLLDMFVRDGVQYFAVVTAANIVNVVYMKSRITIGDRKEPGGGFVGLSIACLRLVMHVNKRVILIVYRLYPWKNAALALVITSMMVCRLILHMRVALSDNSAVSYMTDPDIKPPRVPLVSDKVHLPKWLDFLQLKQDPSSFARRVKVGSAGVTHVCDVNSVALPTFPKTVKSVIGANVEQKTFSTFRRTHNIVLSDSDMLKDDFISYKEPGEFANFDDLQDDNAGGDNSRTGSKSSKQVGVGGGYTAPQTGRDDDGIIEPERSFIDTNDNVHDNLARSLSAHSALASERPGYAGLPIRITREQVIVTDTLQE